MKEFPLSKVGQRTYMVLGGNLQFKIDVKRGICTIIGNGAYAQYDCAHYIIQNCQLLKIYSKWN